MQPIDVVLGQGFASAAAHAAILEIKLRLLAGAVPQLQPRALDQKLEDVEGAIFDHFQADLTSEERDLVMATRRMRNKLLHGAFDEFRQRIGERNPVAAGRIKLIDIPEGASGEGILALLQRPDLHRDVATLPTEGGTLYGWILECQAAGLFDQAIQELRAAMLVVDRLVELNSTRAGGA